MATYRHNRTGTIGSIILTVQVTDAFVQAASVEAEITQPANSFLSKAYLRCVSQPTVTASMDLGVKIGTTTGASDVFLDADGVIDGAANTTAFKTDGMVDLGATPTTAASAVSAAAKLDDFFTGEKRTLFLNTTATNAAIAAAGTVEWILYFDVIPGTHA